MKRLGLKNLLFLAAFLLFAPSVLTAQATAEGTVISNTAEATYTDANGNTYAAVQATATITVGFLPGLSASAAASVSPASPSTANENNFTFTNIGNGIDTISVSPTAAAGLTITGYKIGATSYATLALLNAALADLSLVAGAQVTVTVVYSVATGEGGSTLPLTLTATSFRSAPTTAAATTNIEPPATSGVSVTPDGATVNRLPSNGVTYSETFTVTNNGSTGATFNLTASGTGGVLTIVSVDGVAGSTGSTTLAASGASAHTVVYTVAQVAAGTVGTVTLSAVHSTDATITDNGTRIVTVIRPALSITKVAYRDDQTTLIGPTDKVLPLEYVQFKITVTNTGTASASSVRITDVIPAEMTYVSASGDLAGWTFTTPGGNLQADLTGTLAASASRFIWVRLRVK